MVVDTVLLAVVLLLVHRGRCMLDFLLAVSHLFVSPEQHVHECFADGTIMYSCLKEKVGDVLLPGDEFASEAEETISLTEATKAEKVVCGPGLRRSGDRLLVCKSGVLRHKQPNLFWIDSQQRRVSLTSHLSSNNQSRSA